MKIKCGMNQNSGYTPEFKRGWRLVAVLLALIVALAFGAEHLPAYGSGAEPPQTADAAVKPSPGDLYAKAAVLMDGDSGRILYGKNENEVMPMASTTKVMTLIVVLENA